MTTLREASQQLLEAMESAEVDPHSSDAVYKAITALKAALAEYDKDRVKVEEMKANWALQRKLAQETEERDRQRREYEEQRLAELAEPVQEPVAHLWQHSETGRTRIIERDQVWTASNQWSCVGPLYLAPPQRKPLTDEEIRDLWSWSMTAEAERTATTQQHAFARAIERAHGIGEKE